MRWPMPQLRQYLRWLSESSEPTARTSLLDYWGAVLGSEYVNDDVRTLDRTACPADL